MPTAEAERPAASGSGSSTTTSSSSNTAANQRGVSRVLAKLSHSLAEGEYYEAHMMYRTLYFRYTAQKRYEDCLELLYDGAQKLIEKEQESSAADLCLLLLDTLEKRGAIAEDVDNFQWVPRLGALIRGLSATTVERETLIQRVVKWSTALHGQFGHPLLHKLIAHVFWAEGNIESARHHYLLAQDGSLCGRVLIEISQNKGFQSEVDLFVVQAVLQQLSLKDRKTAEETFIEYTRYHPKLLRHAFPYKEPLVNFLYFLFRLIETKSVTGFRALRKLYDPSLKRDTSFHKYLTKIGVIYFDEQPEHVHTGPAGLGGMFGDIFNRLMQGFDDDDDEQQQQHQSSRPGQQQRQRQQNASNELD
ncbi:Golgi to ER traffic protein 4 homolog [Drosophila nasuta]|uniref:Golgi to ER traffic protein 4 homolog n=1 Tax=Drosophila albomicans TaxID=7291 RepID=A0A6P8XFR6_DROAB|nr:Golgi to ER traffic protein 4 homolog [Drosophila albomicans]XP_060649272.1 Golgi to ER traffic protein 4 homolog [Drosophila nasuta]